MNILTRTVLEVKIGDRFYSLECSPDSPLPDINQALVTMHSYVSNRINEAQKLNESEEVKIEETQEV